MSIHTLLDKIKGRAGEHREKLIFMGILGLVAISAFYLGYVAHAESRKVPPVVIQCPANAYMDPLALSEVPTAPVKSSSTASSAKAGSGPYVASKSGTKYYPVACSGAKRIKDENKVFFASEAAAQSAGLALAAACH
jgi:hypothetical protein